MISHCDAFGAVPGRASAASGFTLIEMIVVLAIVALVTTLVSIRGRPDSPATHARAAAREISGALRTARTESIMTNRSISFTLDVANRSYRWGQQTLRVLPNDLRLALFTSRDQLVAETAGRIRFDPDGGSSGGRVTIAGGDRSWWVGVDWLSGRVSVAETPR